jgi:serine/threonine-protein kinase
MDLFEVTNARYAEFRVIEYDPLASHRPVANVSWNQAAQFCRFHGKRLPTEQEWEKAARGTDGRQYPWGNTYEPVLLNADNRFGETTSVGRFEEGRSPYGLYDMAGNVMEWTDSGDEQVKVFRGGSWVSSPPDVRATSRGSIAPAYRLPDLGFRCAMDAR